MAYTPTTAFEFGGTGYVPTTTFSLGATLVALSISGTASAGASAAQIHQTALGIPGAVAATPASLITALAQLGVSATPVNGVNGGIAYAVSVAIGWSGDVGFVAPHVASLTLVAAPTAVTVQTGVSNVALEVAAQAATATSFNTPVLADIAVLTTASLSVGATAVLSGTLPLDILGAVTSTNRATMRNHTAITGYPQAGIGSTGVFPAQFAISGVASADTRRIEPARSDDRRVVYVLGTRA